MSTVTVNLSSEQYEYLVKLIQSKLKELKHYQIACPKYSREDEYTLLQSIDISLGSNTVPVPVP